MRIWTGQFSAFLPAIDGDDFIGVQNYSRIVVGPDGMIPAAELETELTQMGYEFYPQAVEGVLHRVAGTGPPMFVSENGIATADDSRRTEFIRLALAGVERALATTRIRPDSRQFSRSGWCGRAARQVPCTG